MAELSINLRVRVAWWLPWYIGGVVLMCIVMRREPDNARVNYWAGKAIRVDLDAG